MLARFQIPRKPAGLILDYHMVGIMKTKLSILVFPVLVCASSMAVAEDIAVGTLLALDRKAKMLVLSDRSAWTLEEMKSPLPAELKAGDRVEIRYESDEEGIGEIKSIRLLPPGKTTTGGADISEGTVLVFDRKANLLVLTDRTVWALELAKSPAPAGLKSGDRIRIEYDSDEEGVSSIYGIEVMN